MPNGNGIADRRPSNPHQLVEVRGSQAAVEEIEAARVFHLAGGFDQGVMAAR